MEARDDRRSIGVAGSASPTASVLTPPSRRQLTTRSGLKGAAAAAAAAEEDDAGGGDAGGADVSLLSSPSPNSALARADRVLFRFFTGTCSAPTAATAATAAPALDAAGVGVNVSASPSETVVATPPPPTPPPPAAAAAAAAAAARWRPERAGQRQNKATNRRVASRCATCREMNQSR